MLLPCSSSLARVSSPRVLRVRGGIACLSCLSEYELLTVAVADLAPFSRLSRSPAPVVLGLFSSMSTPAPRSPPRPLATLAPVCTVCFPLIHLQYGHSPLFGHSILALWRPALRFTAFAPAPSPTVLT